MLQNLYREFPVKDTIYLFDLKIVTNCVVFIMWIDMMNLSKQHSMIAFNTQ